MDAMPTSPAPMKMALSAGGPNAAVLRIFLAAFMLLAGGPAAVIAQSAAPPRINCPDSYPVAADLMPAGIGPLTLAQIYCLKLPHTYFTTSAPMISPDAQSVAYYEHDTILRVGRLDGRGGSAFE
jgi:hypothetical protein